MENIIDVHLHIFPGVDDGARDIQETEQMLDALYSQGARVIVGTPHYGGYENKGRNRVDEIWRSMDKVTELAAELYPDLTILAGSEIYCTMAGASRVLELLREGNALTINETKYVLIETSYSAAYKEMFNIMRLFNDEGYHPVLAHVERYDCLFKDKEKVKELVNHGVVIQMNSHSLTPHGLREKLSGEYKWCLELMGSGLVHLLGTDAHSATGNRAPNLEEAYLAIQKKFGLQKVQELLGNAHKLIAGEYI